MGWAESKEEREEEKTFFNKTKDHLTMNFLLSLFFLNSNKILFWFYKSYLLKEDIVVNN